MTRLRKFTTARAAASAGVALATYLALIGMTPAYPSQAVLLLQEGYKGAGVMPDLGAGLFAAVQEKSNLRVLRQLIYSAETAQEVDTATGLRAYFAEHGNLYEQWLAGQDDPGKRLDLFMHVVDVRVDDRAGLLTMEVRAHEPQEAQRIARKVVGVAQHRVNDLAQAAAVDQMRFLEGEAKRLLDEDQKVQLRVAEFQNRSGLTAAEIGIASPQAGPTGGAAPEALLAWQQRLAELQVKRSALQQALRADAPDIQAIDAEMAAVETQIARRKNELLSRGGNAVGKARFEFAGLLTEAQLSRELYLGALRSIAQARSDASRTLKRVDLVQAPTLPVQADRGARGWNLAASLAVGVLLWALLGVLRRYVASHND